MAKKTLKERAEALWEPGDESHLKALDAVLFGVVSIAAVAAFVFQSVERFANREHLFLGGMFTIFALLAIMSYRVFRGPVIQLYGAMIVLGFSACLLFLTGTDAMKRSDWNDERCYRIQTAMLHPSPTTRTDLPDLFQALQCRPQGDGPLLKEQSGSTGDAQRLAHVQEEREALEREVPVDAIGSEKPQPRKGTRIATEAPGGAR
jgi:hypothetical protein